MMPSGAKRAAVSSAGSIRRNFSTASRRQSPSTGRRKSEAPPAAQLVPYPDRERARRRPPLRHGGHGVFAGRPPQFLLDRHPLGGPVPPPSRRLGRLLRRL